LTYVDLYSAMDDGHDRMRADLTDDGLHPNNAGFDVMEPLIQNAIEAKTPSTARSRKYLVTLLFGWTHLPAFPSLRSPFYPRPRY
jgi:putative IMPACT (imprinted ancient) family translation regulator